MSHHDMLRRLDIEVPVLHELFDYWRGRLEGRRLPRRADIDPVDIPGLLPHIMLVDVFDDGTRFRFRLVGTKVASGRDPTGQFLHEAAPKGLYGHHVMALYARAAKAGKPLYSVFDYEYEGRGGPSRIHRLFLPLSEDGRRVNMMLVGQFAESARTIARSAWQSPPSEVHERRLEILDPEASDSQS